MMPMNCGVPREFMKQIHRIQKGYCETHLTTIGEYVPAKVFAIKDSSIAPGSSWTVLYGDTCRTYQ